MKTNTKKFDKDLFFKICKDFNFETTKLGNKPLIKSKDRSLHQLSLDELMGIIKNNYLCFPDAEVIPVSNTKKYTIKGNSYFEIDRIAESLAA